MSKTIFEQVMDQNDRDILINRAGRKVADAAVAEQTIRNAHQHVWTPAGRDYDAGAELAVIHDELELNLETAVREYRAVTESQEKEKGK